MTRRAQWAISRAESQWKQEELEKPEVKSYILHDVTMMLEAMAWMAQECADTYTVFHFPKIIKIENLNCILRAGTQEVKT